MRDSFEFVGRPTCSRGKQSRNFNAGFGAGERHLEAAGNQPEIFGPEDNMRLWTECQ